MYFYYLYILNTKLMGKLYVLKLNEFEIYKIGITKDEITFWQRLYNLQCSCPFESILQWIIA